MRQLSPERLKIYRESTYRIKPELRIHSESKAIEFVNERGFVFFWPIKSDPFPSLWTAVAGDRLVPDDHDDPAHICWEWKDNLLGKGYWYYARVLRRRNTIISLDLLPYFYALSPNYGDPENDYMEDYREGLLSIEARNIYQALLQKGPLNTLDLKRSVTLSYQSSQSQFDRALNDLQMSMRIIPVGVSNAGAWHYAFIYDIVPRHFPDLVYQARKISEKEAFLQLTRTYFQTQGASTPASLAKLFHWDEHLTDKVLSTLTDEGFLLDEVMIPGLPEPYLAINTLC